ncbi:hypothetical protein Plec18167_001946 [Paecilomyces lecythidis]|uniref:COP9 signalosome complex subunit 6 n=1 Tax=Paecilomyces lecythidis TaxID=3004212 RepID=A0ABR3YCV4_9EURO
MAEAHNPLVSSKSSDSGLHVQLHPLVLLTVSDHITRHTARQQQGPILGALLGQQEGREVTLEHAFECNFISGPNGEILLHTAWFEERVKQFKDVHKDPALDLVGWFTVTPPSGPEPSHLHIHRQILNEYNESAVFLAFHPGLINSSSSGAKLPLTIYETVYEGENAGEGDKAMQIDGEEQFSNIRFRELPYSVETGEAEMISVDHVARGGGNATAVEAAAPAAPASQPQPEKKKGPKSTKKGVESEQKAVETSALTPEDEDLIANLNTRLNAVKTLESRIRLIKSYLSGLPPSYLENNSSTESREDSPTAQLSHPILRNVSALISHLSLLTPQDHDSFSTEWTAQSNDVALVSLLGALGNSVKGMRELGRKSNIVESAKHTNASRKTQMAFQSRLDDEYFSGRNGAAASGMFLS